MGDFFNVTVQGEETLTEDLNNYILSLRDPIWEGLSSAADGMTNSLQAHIQSDVYDEYQPTSYPRRSQNPRFGIALIDKRQMEVSFPTALSMSFVYEPTGYHSGKMQDALDAYKTTKNGAVRSTSNTIRQWDKPLKPHPVHGDKLINRIQTGEGYDWKGEFPARPFWDNFVEEQKSGAAIENFAFGFSRGTSDLQLEGGSRDIEWRPEDGALGVTIWDTGFDEDLELPY